MLLQLGQGEGEGGRGIASAAVGMADDDSPRMGAGENGVGNGLGRDTGVWIPGDHVPLDREQTGVVHSCERLGVAAPVREAEHREPLGSRGRRIPDQALPRGETGLRPGIGRLGQGDFILDDGITGP